MGNKFEVKCKNEFHNYFEIEVVENGEVVQKAYAQNIVLNGAFGINNSYGATATSDLSHLDLGAGSGILSPERTSLFNKCFQTAPIKYDIKTNTQKYTTTVTRTWNFKLSTQESIGSSFTELGLRMIGSRGNAILINHAFIKDATGNNVSILKTATNEIFFTATVFYKMQLLNPATTFIESARLGVNDAISASAFPKINSLAFPMSNFVGSDGTYNLPNDPGDKYIVNGNSCTIKRRNYFGTNKCNFDIRTLHLNKNIIVDLTDISIWQGYDVQAETLFTGDSVITEKIIEHDNISNVVVKVDGLIDNTAIITDVDSWLITCVALRTLVSKVNDKILFISGDYGLNNILAKDGENFVFFGCSDLRPLKVTKEGRYIKATNNKFYRLTTAQAVTEIQENEVEGILLDVEPIAQGEIWNGYKVQNGGMYEPSTRKKVSFPIAPPAGAKITVDYHAPYVPKTSDYIFVVEVTETWNEGVQ